MNLYIYKLELNKEYHNFSAWTAEVQATLKAHAEYLLKGTQEKRVSIVGRTDVDLKDNFGICVFEADSQEAAEDFMKNDPVVKNRIMSAQVFPFKLLMVTDEAKKWNVW